MQDRYAGDVGDFGKLGMLRAVESLGLTVGINWYLVGDESCNNDGKHLGYLDDKKFRGCDDELLNALAYMLEQGTRSVKEIEKLNLLRTCTYYHEKIADPKSPKGNARGEWHQKGLDALKECELVFLDPDNGMIPKSVSTGSEKSIKYVLLEEILDYFEAGHSVVFYSHRTREQLDVYLARFARLFDEAENRDATIKGVTFKRGTVRDYIFLIHQEHLQKVENGLARLLSGKWSQHFETLVIPKRNMENDLLSFCGKVGETVTELINAMNRIAYEAVQTFLKGFVGLNEIIRLGEENNWVVIFPGLDLSVADKTQAEIDKYFVDYIDQECGLFPKIKERIISSPLLEEKGVLVQQIFSAIEMEHYALAGIPLASIIEYMLALDVGYNKRVIKNMIKDFKESVGEISLVEDGILLAFGLDGFLKNFSVNTDDFSREKEPRFVNRHWVAHGRMHRNLTKVDVYQMLCAIFALDVVIETEQRVKEYDE